MQLEKSFGSWLSALQRKRCEPSAFNQAVLLEVVDVAVALLGTYRSHINASATDPPLLGASGPPAVTTGAFPYNP